YLHTRLVHAGGQPLGDVPEELGVGERPGRGLDTDRVLRAAGARVEHDSLAGQHGAGRADALFLDQRGHVTPREQGGEAAEGVERLRLDHSVGGETAVALELGDGGVGDPGEGPVDDAGVEAQFAQATLELGDVVPGERA